MGPDGGLRALPGRHAGRTLHVDVVSRGWQGLGPKSREQLAAIGIHTPEDLKAHDAFDVYARLKARWPAASRNLVYALLGAQEGRDWRDIARERRTEVLLHLDALGLAPR
ncbi:MAG: transcriptional regulator [Rubrivivax sp.]|nr:MAG: transcriptional regulator [Rubrivivax sp.]